MKLEEGASQNQGLSRGGFQGSSGGVSGVPEYPFRSCGFLRTLSRDPRSLRDWKRPRSGRKGQRGQERGHPGPAHGHEQPQAPFPQGAGRLALTCPAPTLGSGGW